MTSTTVCGECSLAARSTARPSISRMRRSVMTRSKASLLSASIAAVPPSATVTSCPACLSMIASNSRMLRSSSTTRTRVSGIAGGQRDRERGPEARRAPHVHLPAVLLDDPVDEREAEPGAPGLGGEERFEDVGEVLRRDAVPGVGDPHLQLAAGDRRRPDAQLTPLGHGFDRVAAEVPQHLPELLRVRPPDEGRGELTDDLEAGRRPAVLEQDEDALERLCDVHRLEGERGWARVLEEVRDDLVEPFGLAHHDLRQALARVPRHARAGEDL